MSARLKDKYVNLKCFAITAALVKNFLKYDKTDISLDFNDESYAFCNILSETFPSLQ